MFTIYFIIHIYFLRNQTAYSESQSVGFSIHVAAHLEQGVNDFGVHESAYYKLMYELFVPEHATLILAEHEGTTLAANLVISVGDTAIYLEGASSNEKRKLMAAYGVQWEAIQWAQKRGCSYYDMWGIPDEDESILEENFQDRSDGLWGVYRFKRGWGGDVVRSAGAWDYVYNNFIYSAYKTALKLRG